MKYWRRMLRTMLKYTKNQDMINLSPNLKSQAIWKWQQLKNRKKHKKSYLKKFFNQTKNKKHQHLLGNSLESIRKFNQS